MASHAKVTIRCRVCNSDKVFYRSQLRRENSGKYCSSPCRIRGVRGRRQSPEAKAKIRQSSLANPRGVAIRGKGLPAWNKGIPATWAKGNTWSRGRKISEETKAKIRATFLKRRVLTKDGLTRQQLAIAIRSSIEYRNWRSAVWKRDNFTCQICKHRGGRIEGDHIVPFAAIIKQHAPTNLAEALQIKPLWSISNGRTLCSPCHRATPNYLNRWV